MSQSSAGFHHEKTPAAEVQQRPNTAAVSMGWPAVSGGDSLDEVDEVIDMLSDDVLFDTSVITRHLFERSTSVLHNTTTVGLHPRHAVVVENGAAPAVLSAQQQDSRYSLGALPWQQLPPGGEEDAGKSPAEKSIDLGFGAIDSDICSLLELLE